MSSSTPYDEWYHFYHDEDPPTVEEIQTLREFVENYETPHAIPSDEAARRFMSLCNEVPQFENDDKGERVGWLLWDAGIEMPRYQPAILKSVEAIQALSVLDRTEEQIRTWRFKEKWERWRDMEAFGDIWIKAWQNAWTHRYPGDSFDGDGHCGFPNANSFYANHLLAYPPKSPCSLELGSAFELITFTLEQDPWNHVPPCLQDADSPPYLRDHTWYITMLNANVHGLVPFFEIVGHIIFSFMDKKDLSAFDSLKYADSNLWKGDAMFSMDRWQFWKERLRWISEQNELNKRTRDEAKMLEQLMQDIQNKGIDLEN
ncbi:unnamed protein product [Penicillium glandicola]